MKECFEKPAMDIMKFSDSIYTYPCNVSPAYMQNHYPYYPDGTCPTYSAGMAFLYSHCASFNPATDLLD